MGTARADTSLDTARARAVRTAVALAALALLGLTAPAGAQPPWNRASPGGGGAFLSVDVSPAGKVLVGSDLSGAYLRTGTGPWVRLGKGDGLNRTSVACVRWSPATGDTALACGRNGLFRSTNAGLTWTAAAGPSGFQNNYFGALGWARSHSGTVYAAGATSTADSTVRFWRSLDGGATWSSVAHNLPSTEALRALKLVVHPINPNIVYMVTGPDGVLSPSVLVPKRALYKSLDGGATWVLKSGADSTLDVAVHPTSPWIVLMTVAGAVENTGTLKRSVDASDTWSDVLGNTGAVWWDLPNAYLVNIGLDACAPIPANAGRFASSDGGLTWSRVDTGAAWELGWTDCTHARGIPQSGVANALSARGEYWITSQFVWHYSGGRYTNVFSSSPSAGRWITTGIDNAVPVCFADAQGSGTLYAGYYDLGMWRTQDGGLSWSPANPPLPGWNGVGGNVSTVVADSARFGTVWAAFGVSSKWPYQYQLYRSSNAAATWSPSSSGLPYPAYLYGLSLDRRSPVNNRTLWVTADGALYRSVDDGATWQPAPTAGGLPTRGLFVTEVDRRNGNTVMVGGWAGLWRSTDGGNSWTKLTAGFDHSVAPGEIGGNNSVLHRVKWHGPHQILSDPVNPGKWWVTSYVEDTTDVPSLHRGLYLSTNDGASWTELRRGPHFRGVAIDSIGRRAMLSSSPATTSGSNSSEIEATAGLEMGRSTNGLVWTWTKDPAHPQIRYPFGWAVYADDGAQRWLAVPGYGFFRRPNTPVAVNDAYVVGRNSSSNMLPVLANDYDLDYGDTLTLQSVDLTGTQGIPLVNGAVISYTPPSGFTGVDQFAYTIRDIAGATATATVPVTVVATSADSVVRQVAAGSDDAEESAAGAMNLASTGLDMTFNTTNQTVGLRFDQVTVPKDASITSAWIQFRVDEVTSDATSLLIQGQAADNAPTFTSAAGNISSRPRTAASVPWTPVPWTRLGSAGTDQRTPDLSPLIAEIVGRPGWVSGQSLAIIITGTGRRVAESWNFNPAGAPVLHVHYGDTNIPVAVGGDPPAAPALRLAGPTPSRGAIEVELSLPDGGPARLELMDVAGRRVAARVLRLGPGRHRVTLAERLRSGVYLVRLAQAGRSRTVKAVVIE